MVGYNNKISPYYMSRTSVEEVDGKSVLVIWCPAGINRPYFVPDNVTAKSNTKEYFYVRSGTSSIIAKGEVLDELLDLSSRVPFDERGNPDIKIEDILTLLLREYLVKVGSKLANELYTKPLESILEPVVITVEPQGITIQNVGGPDRSISAADISKCEILVSKRYRNRRLGEYLKDLDLTEGRSTGIPTIQNVLENNGSPRASVVTDDERTFFRITIPCHEAAGNIIADIAHKDGSLKASKRGGLETGLQSGLESAPKSALKKIGTHTHQPTIYLDRTSKANRLFKKLGC